MAPSRKPAPYVGSPGRPPQARAASGSLYWLFVYGTLKRGERAHERFCSGAQEIHPARVTGRLHLHDDGYPILVVPPVTVLARGGPEPVLDLALQRRIDARIRESASMPGTSVASPSPAGSEPAAPWLSIHGDLLGFSRPQRHIPAIDDYEDFDRANPASPYARVLLPVTSEPCASAWAYVATPRNASRYRKLASDVWHGAT